MKLRFILLAVVLAAAPQVAEALPQWIDLGSSVSDTVYKLDYNSLKRNGDVVGFTISRSAPSGNSTATYVWVNCNQWSYIEENQEWRRIPANSAVEFAAKYVCIKSSQAVQPRPSFSGTRLQGKCTFLANSGKDVIDDPCTIVRSGSRVTLLWSDGVYTPMDFNPDGNTGYLTDAQGRQLPMRVIKRISRGMTIRYERGNIGWCWGC